MERNARFSVTANYVLRNIADESILVPVSPNLKNRDCLFVLNATGYAIYSSLKSGRTLAEIEKALCEEFDGAEPGEIRADVEELVTQMIQIEAVRNDSRT